MQLTENAKTIIEKRYLWKDPETGKPIEDAEGMFRRVADFIALAEKPEHQQAYANEFYRIMSNLDFLPNTPCLVNAGRKHKDSGLSACYVLPIEDDIDSIYNTLHDAAVIIKGGGGVGYSFSHLRPRGDVVAKTGGVAGGPVNFMKLFHNSALTIKQGSVRDAAQMAILHCSHPDIVEFITSKEKDKTLNTFNISVAVTDKFMEAVEKDGMWHLVNPRTGQFGKTMRARELWNLIVEYAHKTGDPGLFFIDEANKYNPTPKLGDYEATNPCGEVVLLPGEPCNLGSIVLSNFVADGKEKWNVMKENINWDRLRDVVGLAIRFLDDVITMNAYPVEIVKQMALGNRKIGLGVMGWADMLVKLRIPYGSPEALKLAENVMSFIKEEAYQESEMLATERGCFPNWEDSELSHYTDVWGDRKKQRNSTKLTIAPTGSISIIAGCSSGIEPHFALAYSRRALSNTEMLYYFNDDLQKELDKHFTPQEMREIAKELVEVGTLKKLSAKWVARIIMYDKKLFEIFQTANDVSIEGHILTQAAFQKHVDSSISKTINLPKEATTDQIEHAYTLAWKEKCKGITVYRDGSRSDQVLEVGKDKPQMPIVLIDHKMPENEVVVKSPIDEVKITNLAHGPRSRPHSLKGTTRFIPTGCGDMVVTANYDDHGMAEVIVKGGKSGGCIAAQLEAIGRLASLAMRSGVPKEKVISQLSGISCHLPVIYPGGPGKRKMVKSCGDAIAIGLIEAVAEMEGQTVEVNVQGMGVQGGCPICGGPVKHESGCVACQNMECGWSKC